MPTHGSCQPVTGRSRSSVPDTRPSSEGLLRRVLRTHLMFHEFNLWLIDNAVIFLVEGERYSHTWRGAPLYCSLK